MSRTRSTRRAGRGELWLPVEDVPDVLAMRPQAVVIVAAMIVGFMQLLPAGPARAVLVAPLVILVPGWAAHAAIFGRSRSGDAVASLLFVVALGMGVLILNGLVLNLVGVRLSRVTLVVGPAVIASLLLMVARARGTETTLPIPVAEVPRIAASAAVLLVAVAIAATAVTVAAQRLPTPASDPFAEISFAPAYVKAAQAPDVSPGQVVSLPLQIRLRGIAHRSYIVTTEMDGVVVGSKRADASGSLWKGSVNVRVPPGRCLHKVQIKFTPRVARGASAVSLNTYLSVTAGAACQA